MRQNSEAAIVTATATAAGPALSPVTRSLLAAFAAMCLQAAWAGYVNSAHGPWIAGRSAMVQGASSFCMTYLVTLLMERLLLRWQAMPRWPRTGCTAATAIGAMLTVQSGAHWLAHTPHIAATIAPASLIGTIYCIGYTAGRTLSTRKKAPYESTPAG